MYKQRNQSLIDERLSQVPNVHCVSREYAYAKKAKCLHSTNPASIQKNFMRLFVRTEGKNRNCTLFQRKRSD